MCQPIVEWSKLRFFNFLMPLVAISYRNASESGQSYRTSLRQKYSAWTLLSFDATDSDGSSHRRRQTTLLWVRWRLSVAKRMR